VWQTFYTFYNFFFFGDCLERKILLGTLIALILTPIFYMQVAAIQTNPIWYGFMDGVLHTDTYTEYSWKLESLYVGFSEFGEIINPEDGVGLRYGDEEVFCHPDIPKVYWRQGWMVWITYDHIVYGSTCIWAFALWSDFASYGGDWVVAENVTGPPYGGRKTNGTAENLPPQLIYNGSRRIIWKVETIIGDEHGTDIIKISTLIVFCRVYKHVKLIRDIELLASPKAFRNVEVKWSEHAQWDLKADDSFVHFYWRPTIYGDEWHTNDILNRFLLFQAISEDKTLVGYATYWALKENAYSFTPNGWNYWTEPLPLGLEEYDMPFEPNIPYSIVQWSFPLQEKYRIVVLYGLTDRNNAEDEDMNVTYSNIIDEEVIYLTDKEFNPRLPEMPPIPLWLVVGRDADTVDVLGASYMSSLLTFFTMETGIWFVSATDAYYMPETPWVVSFIDEIDRIHLRSNHTDIGVDENWTLPIVGGSIFSVGGPYATLVSMYCNDYIEALCFTEYGLGIYALTDWDKTFYEPNELGYGVISFYWDLNGTFHFLVWGWTGQDTYFTCLRFIWDIFPPYTFHQIFPYIMNGATTVIITINYTYAPIEPDFIRVIEVLSPISEFL